jgi:hypothetical protein
MTVSELIEKLKFLPQDQIVYLNWEGELVLAKTVEVTDCHNYSVGGSVSVDYYPECRLANDGEKYKAVLID